MTAYKKINGSLTDNERDALIQGIDQLETTLSFTTVDLSPQEVNRFAKMGPATVAFVTAALELAAADPDLTTASTTPQELQKNLTMIRNIESVVLRIEKLREKLKNTAIVVKAEAYKKARTTYSLLKRKGAAGLRDGRDRLAQRYKKQGNRKPNKAIES